MPSMNTSDKDTSYTENDYGIATLKYEGNTFVTPGPILDCRWKEYYNTDFDTNYEWDAYTYNGSRIYHIKNKKQY